MASENMGSVIQNNSEKGSGARVAEEVFPRGRTRYWKSLSLRGVSPRRPLTVTHLMMSGKFSCVVYTVRPPGNSIQTLEVRHHS